MTVPTDKDINIYIYVCVCVCLCVCMYVYMYVYMCVYIRMCVYVCIYVCMYMDLLVSSSNPAALPSHSIVEMRSVLLPLFWVWLLIILILSSLTLK